MSWALVCVKCAASSESTEVCFTIPHCPAAVNGAEVPPVDVETVLQLKRELCGIRNKVNALLDVLDTARVADTLPTATDPPPSKETSKKQLPGTKTDADWVHWFLHAHHSSMWARVLSSLSLEAQCP